MRTFAEMLKEVRVLRGLTAFAAAEACVAAGLSTIELYQAFEDGTVMYGRTAVPDLRQFAILVAVLQPNQADVAELVEHVLQHEREGVRAEAWLEPEHAAEMLADLRTYATIPMAVYLNSQRHSKEQF